MKHLFFIFLLCILSCQGIHSSLESDSYFPISSNALPEIHFKITDNQKIAIEKARFLDAWFAIEYLQNEQWTYSEIRNQGHKVRDDLKFSYKWKKNIGEESEEKVNLSGQSRDVSMIRYALASFLFERAGLAVAEYKHVNLFINQVWQGPYLTLEIVDSKFLEKRSMKEGALFKAQYRSELTLKNDIKVHQAFAQKSPKPIASDLQSGKRLEELAKVLDDGIVIDTLPLANILNIDNAISYLAVSKLIQNRDGIRNNFYLYLNPETAKFEFIPWDLDDTFNTASVWGVYQNNLFEQLEANTIFKNRLIDKMIEIWDYTIILEELRRLEELVGIYAKNQESYYINPKEEYNKSIKGIYAFLEATTVQLKTP